MRSTAWLLVAWLSMTALASAQDALTPADREPLIAQPGVLVHPSLGFRLRDVGLPPDSARGSTIAHDIARSPAAEDVHAWAYGTGDDYVRIVLFSPITPRRFSRDVTARTARAFAELGATAIASSDDGGASEATLRLGPRTIVVRSVPFHVAERRLVVMITAVLADAALATTVARSFESPARPAADGLSRDAIRATIRAWLDDVRHCYESSLGARPELAGRVTASFIIRGDGTVQTAMIGSTTLSHEPTERCIVDVVRSMRFPPTDDGGVVGVNYPFVFDTRDPAAASPSAE